MDRFQIGKGVHQGCVLSACLFNFYAEYIIQNAGLDDSQGGLKTARRNNNCRYADDNMLMAEKEEKPRSLWCTLKKKESEKAGSNLNSQKIKIMASSPIIRVAC